MVPLGVYVGDWRQRRLVKVALGLLREEGEEETMEGIDSIQILSVVVDGDLRWSARSLATCWLCLMVLSAGSLIGEEGDMRARG